MDTGVLAHPPFPIPASAAPLGFTADGELVLLSRSTDEDVSQLTFWNVATGRQTASLVTFTAHDPGADVGDDGSTAVIGGVGGAMPFVLPLTAQQWFDGLCAISDRAFTDAERTLLPAGVSTDPPC